MSHLPRAVALAVAAVTCPCHAPLLVALLAGTSAGAVLTTYRGLVTAGWPSSSSGRWPSACLALAAPEAPCRSNANA